LRRRCFNKRVSDYGGRPVPALEPDAAARGHFNWRGTGVRYAYSRVPVRLKGTPPQRYRGHVGTPFSAPIFPPPPPR